MQKNIQQRNEIYLLTESSVFEFEMLTFVCMCVCGNINRGALLKAKREARRVKICSPAIEVVEEVVNAAREMLLEGRMSV